MEAMGSCDRAFWNVFHEDPIKLQAGRDPEVSELIDFVMKLGFIMAKFAELRSSKAMRQLNEDDYLDWLDQFERADYLEALGAIREVYEGQKTTSVDAKKKDAEPSDS
ncbi:MAG: hypothetical protein IKI21_12800 [Oscillospiraceae bacterium]|nr:hypothetical protein [Oscillospiraceae bacterium]MBR7040102.1 hypothetical protein [Oscillospiraceae bacterium]